MKLFRTAINKYLRDNTCIYVCVQRSRRIMDKCALYKNQNYDIKVKGSYSAMGNGHLKDNALGKYENSSQRHVEEMRLKTKRLYLGE